MDVKEAEEKLDLEEVKGYVDKYDEEGFFQKIKKYSKKIGLGVLYKALQLYYVLQRPEVPQSTKMIIYGALGYLISPLDLIPDITPMIGYTDDAMAIALALAQVSGYVDENVNNNAKQMIDKLFGTGASEEV